MPPIDEQPENDYDNDWDAHEALADPDGPQPCDLTDPDDETPTVPCPHCGNPVPDFADRCSHCGDWILQSSGAAGTRGLIFAAVAVLLILALLWWLL